MNAESNVISTASEQPREMAARPVSRLQRIYWSVRRELWEYRSIYLSPAGVAGLFLCGFLVSTIHLPAKVRALANLPFVEQHAMEEPYGIAAGLIMGIMMIVSIFYCVDSLYSERRDRSILFWKSLPLSDLETVLSKACIPLLVIPIVAWLVTVATQLIILLISTIVLAASGLSVSLVWTHISLTNLLVMSLYHLFAIHALWYAPFYGWMMFASAWARRVPFLWAVLPPIAVSVVERIAFNTSHFANLLQTRMIGGSGAEMPFGAAIGTSMDAMKYFTPLTLLASPGLWIGFAITAIFLLGAARLRRYRDPI